MDNIIQELIEELTAAGEFSDPVVLHTTLGEFSGRYASEILFEDEESFRYFLTDDGRILRIYIDEDVIYTVMEPIADDDDIEWETI